MKETVAHLPYGAVRGLAGPGGVAFRGVRYAEPPVGPARFMPPVPRRRAAGETDARFAGPAPPQPGRTEPAWSGQIAPALTNEDCLNLNVFTPAADDARRPVLVHTFGGGFQTGSADSPIQDAAALSRANDVVVVRVNMRVGALGYLWLGGAWGAPFAAGNVALLDICAALAWVRDNIAGLGGDPDCVTLFGLSSGAFSIAALAAVPEARRLFHRAWMQSGSASRIVDPVTAADQASAFLRVLGIVPGDLAALQSVPVDHILYAQEQVVAIDLGERNAPGGRTLGVVADGVTLARHPLAAIRDGVWRDVPVVLGATAEEARLWFARGLLKPAGSRAALAAELARFAGADRAAGVLAAYEAAHPGASLDGLREHVLGDVIYRLPALRTALAQAGAGGRGWAYRFDWRSPLEGGTLGASHGFDEPFVWNTTARAPYAAADPAAAAVADTLSSALIRFARTGSPGWAPVATDSSHVELFGTQAWSRLDAPWLLSAWAGIERL